MRQSEQGIALIVTILAMLLLSALGAALVLATSADAAIAANEGAATEAFYAAEAAFERTLAELQAAPDFTAVLVGSTSSAFRDAEAEVGDRTLPDGTSFDLGELLNLANCEKRVACSEADLDASIRDRPWGARNPRWRLWSWGSLATSSASVVGPAAYVVAMVADDPTETDADPWVDGAPADDALNPGAGILLVRAEALGRRGAHRTIQGTVVRRDLAAHAAWEMLDPATRGPEPSRFPLMQVMAWHEVR